MSTKTGPLLGLTILAGFPLLVACRRDGDLAGGVSGDGSTEAEGPTSGLDGSLDRSLSDHDREARITDARSDMMSSELHGSSADGTSEAATADGARDGMGDGGLDATGNDGANGRVVMFGGNGFVGSGNSTTPKFFADTWVWDGLAWTKLDAAGPSARVNAVAATLDKRVVLFGGCTSGFGADGGPTFEGDGGPMVSNAVCEDLDDTWVLDGTVWSEQNVSGPSARLDAIATTLNGKVLLFGGSNGSALGDTWEWDGTAWTQLNVIGPSPRFAAIAGTLNGKIMLFGGVVSNQPVGDTWEWDGVGWSELKVSGPSARSWAAAATLNDKVVLFGGLDGNGNALNDTWEWNGASWKQINVTGPSARAYSEAATLNGRIVLFAGGLAQAGNNFDLNDTWEWNGTTWAQQNVSGPPARYGPAGMAGP